MRALMACVIAVAAATHAPELQAYQLECRDNACDVKCDNGQKVGTMYWNGSAWSDGLRSDPDKHVVAKLMVAAWGSSCT